MKRRTAPATLAAVVYLRVSTAEQAASGLGREAQEAACRAHCSRLGWPVLSVHVDDGLSGTLPVARRPGLVAAVAAVKAAPGAALVVASVSRLARTQLELWQLVDDRGEWALPLVSASEPFDVSTAAGRAFLGMLATFATLEADMCSDRTSAALAAAKARGVTLGAPKLLSRPAMAPAIERAHALRAEGLSLRAVVDKLNAEGIAAAKGGPWHLKTLRAALAVP